MSAPRRKRFRSRQATCKTRITLTGYFGFEYGPMLESWMKPNDHATPFDGSSARSRFPDSFQGLPGVLLALPGADPALFVPERRDDPLILAIPERTPRETVHRQDPRGVVTMAA